MSILGKLFKSDKGYIEELEIENKRLQKAVEEALEFACEGWAYASDYFKEKWDYAGELKRLKEYGKENNG